MMDSRDQSPWPSLAIGPWEVWTHMASFIGAQPLKYSGYHTGYRPSQLARWRQWWQGPAGCSLDAWMQINRTQFYFRCCCLATWMWSRLPDAGRWHWLGQLPLNQERTRFLIARRMMCAQSP